MGLRQRFGKLFGKAPARTETMTADQARAQQMHGQDTGQTTGEQDATRRRMEAELDVQRTARAAAPTVVEAACPHTVLVARWDMVADMGNEERASGFTCEACQQAFSAEEGRMLRQTEADRVRRLAEG